MIRTYSELKKLQTFEERFEYLKLGGVVGSETFGSDRYFNQKFYNSKEWKRIRDEVIVRDGCCDLGIEDRQLYSNVIIHHMNPISMEDIEDASEFMLNPEYLVCVSHNTHQAIHYGSSDLLVPTQLVERKKNDTIPWRK